MNFPVPLTLAVFHILTSCAGMWKSAVELLILFLFWSDLFLTRQFAADRFDPCFGSDRRLCEICL